MNCKNFEGLLALYLYEELPAEERAACEAHLAGCERCRSVLEKSRRLHQVLSQRMVPEPTPELLVHCRQRLDEALDREQLGWRGLLRAWFSPKFAASPSRALAALTLVAFGFSLGWILRPRAPTVVSTGGAERASTSLSPADLGRISSISQVSPDPQTGEVRITLNAERRVTMEGSLDDPHIQQVLLYAVKSYDNPGIRLDTLGALQTGSKNPPVKNALLYALEHDANAGVRLEALKSVRKMDWCPEVRDALLTAAERDTNLGVRDEAIDELVEHAVSSRDQELVPALKRLAVTDSDHYVRLKSIAALRELGQEPF